MLEQGFTYIVAFCEDEIQQSYERWKTALVDKFLSHVFPLDFIQKSWKKYGIWKESFVFLLCLMVCLLFQYSTEEGKSHVLTLGPWSLASQLLALESWRLEFQPGKDCSPT